MILEKLYQCYDVLANDEKSNIAPIGYSSAKVSFEIILSKEGDIIDIVDLRKELEKKTLPVFLLVPLQRTRASGITPYFLCDKSKYVFGIENENFPRHFEAFQTLNKDILGDVCDEEAEAFVRFLDRWDVTIAREHECIAKQLDDILTASNFVFRLEGKLYYLHENDLIRKKWEAFFESTASEYVAPCLVTGKEAPISQVHQGIKGVVGAQPTGAAIVSFNIKSFISYNKKQSMNAPISETAMLKYTTALNYLLAGKNRIRLGDTTTVFWAERVAKEEEEFLSAFVDPPITEERNDRGAFADTAASAQKKISDILHAIKDGKTVREVGFDPEVTFHTLGLAPNVSRLSIRFWMVNHFGDLIEKMARHYLDMEITKPPGAFVITPTWMLLKEIAVLGKTENIPNSMISSLSYAIFNGTAYPFGVYARIIGRIRADGDINYKRAGFIKAYLNRNNRIKGRKEEIQVALDVNTKEPAYLLGRLFSLMEKAQQDASGGGLNSTIKDRYFGAASSTPAIIFPQLLRLSQHHMAKAQFGGIIDRQIQDVINGVGEFPRHLNLNEQGMFILGYYHQKQANYAKKNNEEARGGNENGIDQK